MKKVLWKILRIITTLAGVAGVITAYIWAGTEDYISFINERGIIDPDVTTNTTPLLVMTTIFLGIAFTGVFLIERRKK